MNTSKLSPALQKLIGEFKASLPDKYQEVVALAEAASAGAEDAIEDFYHATHKLAGSSGSYGFRPVSEVTRLLDRYLADVRAGEAQWDKGTADKMLSEIRAKIDEVMANS